MGVMAGPVVAIPPVLDGLGPVEVGRVVLLWVMSNPDRVFAFDLLPLEAADHYGVSVIGSLGGRAADPVVLRHVQDARGIIARAIVTVRAREDARRRELARAFAEGDGASTGGDGGAAGGRVDGGVTTGTREPPRPPGGVGVALPAPVSGWSFS